MDFTVKIDSAIFHCIGNAADNLDRECYVVGGYVRDLVLGRHSKDMDFVTVGSGIELAEAVANDLGPKTKLTVFRNFGTAQVKCHDTELEFVGARKESYRSDSRKPIVEDATLDEDLSRRDFTINAMAVSVNRGTFGTLIDRYDGMGDIARKIIRTPLDPDMTFSDDPLRMMRAIRFATQLQFDIASDTLDAISRNADRIKIISEERINTELSKIMESEKPSIGWQLLLKTGLLEIILPELAALQGVSTMNGRAHKENFGHTMQVLDRVAAASDNVWLRWAALFHDIAKPVTKRWDERLGWTFHNHNFIGAKMIPKIFARLKLPLNDNMKYVKRLVELHMRPVALVESTVTDSALRRLCSDAEGHLEELMILCEADITSKNPEKVRRCLANLAIVREKIDDLGLRDQRREYQPPVNALVYKRVFGLSDGPVLNEIKTALKEAYFDGKVTTDYDHNFKYMLETIAPALGLTPVDTTPHSPSDIKEKKKCTSSANASK